MTDIKAILAKYDISVPEEHAAEFDKVFKENYKTVAEVAKIEAARDNYKFQLTTAQDTLKTFEGVDVNELQGDGRLPAGHRLLLRRQVLQDQQRHRQPGRQGGPGLYHR